MIDWAKIAEPQPDGSDTAVILERAAAGRYKRLVPADGPLVWSDGRCCWQRKLASPPSSEFMYLDEADSIVQESLRRLEALWPAVRKQCADLLVAIHPMTVAGRQRGQGHGCTCGHYADDFGWIYVTADDVWGFCEGIVHEMGHWKLRALGIWFEDWTDAILLNTPDELYDSPVRKDKPRPMGAVLHAQYSYIHVAKMTTLLLQATEKPDRQDREWCELQITRITEGLGTLRKHARGTPGVGDAFLEAVNAWTDRVIADGHAALAATAVP